MHDVAKAVRPHFRLTPSLPIVPRAKLCPHANQICSRSSLESIGQLFKCRWTSDWIPNYRSREIWYECWASSACGLVVLERSRSRGTSLGDERPDAPGQGVSSRLPVGLACVAYLFLLGWTQGGLWIRILPAPDTTHTHEII